MAIDEKNRVIELIEKPLADRGYEVADIVISRFKARATLRLFVYSEAPATVGECASLSRLVGDLIEGTDLFNRGYTLEVSTPGLDRPLTSLKDFKYRAGETVRIEFVDDDRKKETAEIKAVIEDKVEFQNDSGPFILEMAEIKRAKIRF